jgi:hypothetical protein
LRERERERERIIKDNKRPGERERRKQQPVVAINNKISK